MPPCCRLTGCIPAQPTDTLTTHLVAPISVYLPPLMAKVSPETMHSSMATNAPDADCVLSMLAVVKGELSESGFAAWLRTQAAERPSGS